MPGARLALVVANGAYEDAKLRALRAPAADAELLASVLRDERIGDFQVSTLFDEPAAVVAEEVEGFFADRRRDDLLLLYLSCHGVKDPDGRLYFAVRNTKLHRLAATGVSAQFVNEQMNRSRSRRIVLLLDCCYSGAFTRLGSKSTYDVHVRERFDGHGRAVLTASNAMEYAFEGEQLSLDAAAPSVFTAAVVRGLRTGAADRDGDGRVSVHDLYEYVYDSVQEHTTGTQTPGMFASLHGSIYLARDPRAGAGTSLDPDPGTPRPGPALVPVEPPGGRTGRWRRWARSRWRWAAGAAALVLLLVLGVVVSRPSPTPQWTRVADLPAPVEAAAVTAHLGGIWVAGGISPDEDRHKLDAVQVYDPRSGTWSSGPRLPVPLSHAALVSDGSRLFLLGGWAQVGAVAEVWRLDRPDGQWTPDRPLPGPRTAGAAAWDGARVVFAGGVAPDQQATATVWALQQDAWHDLPPLQVAREKLAAVTDSNGTVWFVGGRDRDAGSLYGAVDEVAGGRTRSLGYPVPAVEAPGGVWWPGVGPCVVAGYAPDGFSDRTACWRGAAKPDLPRLPEARAGVGAAVLDGVVYVVGGYNDGEHGSGHVFAFRP
ncbi:caspase family protein [Actinosynnema sp. NPDC059335]|uniref:caspase, EACC1-associated type n=1 Tax=Actinosynnema sp. NPDC059335 TaxID=3346804 RepID=UPI00366F67F3